MSQGVLMFALNNEQIDYVELALYAAKQVKKHLNKPVALATDCFYYLEEKYPDYKNYIDHVIRIVNKPTYNLWNPSLQYDIGSKVIYNSFVYEKVNEGPELLYDYDNSMERVYTGIEVDKWYANLPYLQGQHVWYNNVLYKCNTSYTETDQFSMDKYDVLIPKVKDLSDDITKGDIFLAGRFLYLSNINTQDLISKYEIRTDLWKQIAISEIVFDTSVQYRKYFDGALSQKRLKFSNEIRIMSYDISPFDETLVIDTDYIINNDKLKYCWEQPHDFLINKNATDLSGYRYDPRLHTLSDKSITFYWATVFFFRKTLSTKVFFDYLGHIKENWNYYRLVYQIENALYRNDFAFSIGIHIMNGYQEGDWTRELPIRMLFTTDKDVLVACKDNDMKFLVQKEKFLGEYTLLKTSGLNVHVMNKFSLSRTIREAANV